MAAFAKVEARSVRILDALEQITEWTGRTVAWLTLFMVFGMLAIVIARYAFDVGSIAAQESILYLHATVFFIGAAFALKHDRHVRVDIFYRQFSPKTRAAVDLVGTLLFLLPMAGFLLVESLPYVQAAWNVREGSREAGGLPYVYILKTLIPVGAGLLGFQAILFGLRNGLTLWRN